MSEWWMWELGEGFVLYILMFCNSGGPQVEVLNKHLFLTAKPVIYLVNLSERDYIRKKNKWYIHKNRCLCVECIQLSSYIAATVQCVCKWQE